MGPEVIAAIISAIVSVIGTAAGVGSTISSNKSNLAAQESANDSNVALAKESNVAQALESEKAYSRSKATNQVALLRQAGMSHAGALNVLSGGGSYTPAPVNTAQVSSFRADSPFSSDALSGLSDMISSVGSNVAQRKQNQKQFDASLNLQKQQHEDELSETKRVNDAAIANQNSQTASNNYHLAMEKLKSNPEVYNAVGRLKMLCDPQNYSTAFRYLQAVKSSAGDDAEFLNNEAVSNALTEQWNQANSQWNTTADTEVKFAQKSNIDQSTENLKETFKTNQLQNRQLEQVVNEYFSSDAMTARRWANGVQAISNVLNFKLTYKNLVQYLQTYYKPDSNGVYHFENQDLNYNRLNHEKTIDENKNFYDYVFSWFPQGEGVDIGQLLVLLKLFK